MKERTVANEVVFQGRLIKVEVRDVVTAAGVSARREIVRHPGAAVVLAQLPDGRFLFVRQFRSAVGEAVLETVAGLLEPDEDPAACAARETREETGHEPETIRELGILYPSPGYTDERLYAFHARLSAEPLGTDRDGDEDLETVPMTAEEIERRMAAGDIRDAKTLAAWMLLRLGR
jgi:ADP-ribose pyrophosphatase